MPEPSKIEPLSGMRRAIAQNMRDSLTGTAQLSYFLEVDVTEAQSMRRQVSGESGVTITMASVLIKACAESLQRVPALNSILVNDNVMYFDEVNMGVAVALDDGLIVPVLKGVQDMSIPQIADGVRELSEKARSSQLSSSEISGGTFTISVLGVVDGFTPILNPPQNALARRGAQRAEAGCAKGRGRGARDDDAQLDGRPSGHRRGDRSKFLPSPPAACRAACCVIPIAGSSTQDCPQSEPYARAS